MTDMIPVTTLRPGRLVGLTIKITGNVKYNTRDLEQAKVSEDGSERARWETERVVKNARELRKAEKVRAAARQLINKSCARSSFGLLCPEAWVKDLYTNIAEAKRLAREFNAKARHTEVEVNTIVATIAQDDVEAAKSVNAEIRGLMREMTEGIKEVNPKRVREAASRMRSVGMMLSEGAQEKAKAAIAAAREQARKFVKAGDEAAKAIDQEVLKKISQARTAFLDLDASEVLMEKPKAAGRGVDLDPNAEAGGDAAMARAMPKKKGSKKSDPTAPKKKSAAKSKPRQLELLDEAPAVIKPRKAKAEARAEV